MTLHIEHKFMASDYPFGIF